ncbi:T9SS type B sorting domain-containing protein [Maribacter sp. 4G9]|uniref:T9SS type B sorting domain-containing protein n=1 Tax=Maribacter sp. 4G9 TaxID=1889777 RepID=UPI0013FD4124|nr:T9SS type B sorting domain-containing protein [Maribacter sp. 4G9]
MPIFIMLMLFSNSSILAQECPALVGPLNGENQVATTASISWKTIEGVPGYIISLGTTQGGRDILDELNVGSSNRYTPPTGLPENTQVFVTITLFFFNQANITCESQSFTTAALSEAPGCTFLSNPTNNAIDVNTATNISWAYAPGATGYLFTMGTTPNGNELVPTTDLGNTLSYNPTSDLPTETTIYVTIAPYNRIDAALDCTTFVFTTAREAVLPVCTNLITPFNGERNVPLSPILEWNEVPNATGYRVSIGTNPFETDILNNAAFFRTSTMVIDFEPNRTFFIKIVPFNDAGEAIGCSQETFSTLLGCGPYFHPITNELIVLNPEITFPDTIGICRNDSDTIVSATDEADGYRWYRIDLNGNEDLISIERDVSIDQAGDYIHEIYNVIDGSSGAIECSTSKIFRVEESSIATIENVRVTEVFDGLNFEVIVEGNGNYEFALDNPEGAYQASNNFSGITPGTHTVYVRDINGCGVTEKTIQQDLTVEGFPKFFTPNGDGTNDFWQYRVKTKPGDDRLMSIYIYNRYGNLLAQLHPDSLGWDGRLNGKALPESNYWFKAQFEGNKEVKGYFILKR